MCRGRIEARNWSSASSAMSNCLHGRCAVAELKPTASPVSFRASFKSPRPMCRGRIEARSAATVRVRRSSLHGRCAVAELKPGGGWAADGCDLDSVSTAMCRGRIEARPARRSGVRGSWSPRPMCRGRIEAQAPSLPRLPTTCLHGRCAVAELKPISRSPSPFRQDRLHGRCAVAELKLAAVCQ